MLLVSCCAKSLDEERHTVWVQKVWWMLFVTNVERIDGCIWLSAKKDRVFCWPWKDHAVCVSLAALSPLCHTARAAFLMALTEKVSLELVDVSDRPKFSWEQRLSAGVIAYKEPCAASEARSCDFPDFDMCLLSFKGGYADLSCENGCSQMRWRCFAICHEMRFATSLQVKHQIDLNFLLKDESHFLDRIFPFSFHWIVIFTKRYRRNCYWKTKCSLWVENQRIYVYINKHRG